MGILLNHCIGIRFISKDDILYLFDLASKIKSTECVPQLNSLTVAHVFFEPSTRTRLSFEKATQNCNAFPMMLDVKHSSLTKGESLIDMMKNIESLGVDALVIRHSNGGVPYFISQHVNIPVINAGDGYHEHPSQGLLDLFTLQENLGELVNKHILILGDIRHSRVAKSNIWGLLKLGAKVSVAGPPNLVPACVKQLGVNVVSNLDSVLPEVDAVNVLRIQFERQHGIALPSVAEYRSVFGLTAERQKMLKNDAIVLHPGPINRGIELDSEVADGDHNVILSQVQNGVYIRMAILKFLLEGR
ncbi:MAG: aspartate carbamoyltransferase catalytic subunit [Candidatus Margulisiibacteriota bacterium]|nr:aspartate carbamoyltransferase catalytic subunit [Candidatus Margulisiibacteriota bacterium]